MAKFVLVAEGINLHLPISHSSSAILFFLNFNFIAIELIISLSYKTVYQVKLKFYNILGSTNLWARLSLSEAEVYIELVLKFMCQIVRVRRNIYIFLKQNEPKQI